MGIDDLLQDFLQLFLADHEINFQLQVVVVALSIDESQILRKNLVEDQASQRGLDLAGVLSPIGQINRAANPDSGMVVDDLVLKGQKRLVDAREMLALAGLSLALLGQIVNTQNHIL